MISVLVPCYNEATYIETCIRSLIGDGQLSSDEAEVIVLDGGSSDATVRIVSSLVSEFANLTLVHNPNRSAAAAMNLGLSRARGEIIVRIDAHALYPRNYVRRLAVALDEYEADVVGGVWDTQPQEKTAMGIAQARVLQHPLAVGNAHHRIGVSEPREVDTVPFGCWRRSTLDAVGGFAEELSRSQDFELTQRLRRGGAKVMLLPDLVVTYYARSKFGPTFKYNISNGYWVSYPQVVHGVQFSVRHYIPTIVVVGGLGLTIVAAGGHAAPILACAAAYAALTAKVTLDCRPRASEPATVWVAVPVALAALHLAHGLGGIQGFAVGVWQRSRRRDQRIPTARKAANLSKDTGGRV